MAATFFWVVVGYLMASYAGSYWPLALMMILATMGDAAWHPMATGILVRAAPERRATVLGIHAVGGTLSGVFAPLLAGFLLESLDWRTTLQLSLIPTALAGAVFLFYLAKRISKIERASIEKPNIRELLRLWATPSGLTLAAAMMAYNLGLTGTIAMTPLYLRDAISLNAFETGLIFSGATLAGALSQPTAGRLSDRIARRPVIGVASVGGAAGAFAVYSTDSALVAIAGLIVCIGLLDAVRSCVLASAVDLVGKSEATTLGVAFMVLDGIGAFGAVAAGYLGATQIADAYLLAVVCGVVAGTLTLALGRMRHSSATAR